MDFKYGILAIFIGLIQYTKAASRIDPLVETKLGLIRGLRATDGDYSMFMGIPYAIVDEANPFGASIPHPGFDEVFEAFDDSAICPQEKDFSNIIQGSLDCLHLNIYVPNSATSRNKLPVLVWIHGGAFMAGYSGRSSFGPSYLVRHDVILVTLNYRLGAYGFMCLDTPDVPGNQGLKDQELALKWIKDNIDSFGGDTNKITLSGESAGGASVDLHLFFNKDNLFNQVIMQSGSAMVPWVTVDLDSSKPIKLANHLGVSTESVDEALIFLATVDPKLVIAAANELNLKFGPCVEESFDDVESFMTEHPINVDIPRVRDVPVLIGNNNDEMLFEVLTLGKERDYDTFNMYLKDYFNFDEDALVNMERIIRHFYIGDENVDEQTIWSVTDFGSDITFNYATQRSIQKYIENNANVVYQYIFAYTGERNFIKEQLNISIGGAAHADELSYLFDVSYLRDPSPEDQLVIDRMTTLWTNFVKFGNPTPEISELLPVAWTPVTKDSSFYLNIDSEITLGRRPFHDRMAFWDLFYKLNNRYLIGFNDS